VWQVWRKFALRERALSTLCLYSLSVVVTFCSDTSTDSAKKLSSSQADVSYFRNLIKSESDRLSVLCAVWRSTMEDLNDLTDEGSLQPMASIC